MATPIFLISPNMPNSKKKLRFNPPKRTDFNPQSKKTKNSAAVYTFFTTGKTLRNGAITGWVNFSVN